MTDFIGVYDNVFPVDFCEGLIQYYNWCKENNKTWLRSETTKTMKHDESCLINPTNQYEINFTKNNLSGYLTQFNEIFWDICYKDYREKYSILDDLKTHTIFSYKIQETFPAGGYHVWHAEQDCIEHSRRIASYIVYLNDVIEGGETEFLYQSVRVKPSRGTLVVFPASYTHTHRGNPPLSGVKYILTGWIEFL